MRRIRARHVRQWAAEARLPQIKADLPIITRANSLTLRLRLVNHVTNRANGPNLLRSFALRWPPTREAGPGPTNTFCVEVSRMHD